MTKTHRAGVRGTGLTQAAARPFRPHVYRGGDIEPPEVTAARERYRAHAAALDALAGGRTCGGEEVTPDAGPGYEWYRELADGDELTELAEARDRYQAALAAAPGPGQLPELPPVTSASRCGQCGYLTTATGHKVTCDD